MSTVSSINQVKHIVATAPVTEILEIAEVLVTIIPIPGLPMIIKILKVASKLQDPTTKALGVSSQIVENVSDAQNKKLQDDIIEQMIEIAIEDGVFDDEEEIFLRNKAVQMGIDPDILMLRVRKKIH